MGSAAQAQSFRFSLRADPDIIPANGISTTSILVQVQQTGGAGISAAPVARFLTTAGTIESQTRLSGGIARVLLRSSTTPGTAIVTAFVGNAREQIAVEFSADNVGLARYLDVSGSYVAYGDSESVITSSGKCALQFGEIRIESDVRLDVDLRREFIWAEGNAGRVFIRYGNGERARELRGDRLFFDLRRRRGVMRRSDSTLGAARQEFMGTDFRPIPKGQGDEAETPKRPTRVKNAAKVLEESTPLVDSTSRPGDAVPPASAMQTESAPNVEPPAETTPDAVEKDEAAEGTSRVHLAPRDREEDATTLLHAKVVDNGVQSNSTVPAVRAPLVSPLLGETANETVSVKDNSVGSSNGLTPRLTLVPPRGGKDTAPTRDDGKTPTGEEPQQAAPPPVYSPLDDNDGEVRLHEPSPPAPDVAYGYWVAARRMLVYPHDRIQAEKATLFLNGGKIFSLPRYVVPLNGAFNPGQDMVSYNTSAGLTLNVPYYYMASPRGQGTVYFQHAPGNGFAAEKPGFALAVEQQYWMSNRSNGKLIVDQLGRGGWNLGWEHKLQFSPTTNARFSLDMPRHRDLFARSAIYKDLSSVQLGLEGFLSRPDGGKSDAQGQFFARMRPRQLGHTGWTMTMGANFTAWNHYAQRSYTSVSTGGSGGGIGLPGRPRPGTGTQLVEKYRPAFGQTLDISLQGPQRRLWKGATLDTTLRMAAFNHSINGRGVAPGWTLGFNQQVGRTTSLRLDYTYDRSGSLFTGINGGSNASHFVSGSLSIVPTDKIAFSAFATHSLSDRSLYGSASLDYAFAPKWRAGLFSDYSSFTGEDSLLDYGWSIGRTIGQREISINWSQSRERVYFELGGFRY